MKASQLKTESRTEEFKDGSFAIRRWGLKNNYPDKITDIRSASGTATLCYNIYRKFLLGQGFENESLNSIEIAPGFTLLELLALNSADFAALGGFAVHRNLNVLKEPVNHQYTPIDFLRFEVDLHDKYAKNTGRYKLHQSWGGRVMGLSPRHDEVIIIDPFTDDPALIEKQINGDITKYNGQIFYFSNIRGSYPMPIYDPVISDMSTEDSVATVKNRNAKNNFLPAGVFAIKGKNSENGEAEAADDNGYIDSNNEVDKMIKAMQGDKNSFSIGVVELDYDEEAPTFIPFPIQKGDRLFELTEQTVQQNIGKIFMQPRVLRAEEIAGKLGTSNEIVDAMNFYNYITQPERDTLKAAYTKLFANFKPLAGADFTIKPLNYMTRGTNQ